MLHENLKKLRKAKGYSQEELASRLHVVRQTVSKWEKGLSVPDAEMLIKLAELFEMPVAGLLGSPAVGTEAEGGLDPVAEQLSRINEQLCIKNRRARRIWRILGFSLLGLLLLQLLLFLFSYSAFSIQKTYTETVPVRGMEHKALIE